MNKILALIWALVTRRRACADCGQPTGAMHCNGCHNAPAYCVCAPVDLVPADCDDCGYPMGYCCCVPDDERCTAWSQKTVDQAGRIGGAGERCPERAVASGGEIGGGLPPTSWAYCEHHHEEHLERERDNYDAFDYYDYDDYGYAGVAR